MGEADTRGPGLRFPPPLLALGIIAVAWLAQRWIPLPINTGANLLLPGVLLVAIALLIAITAIIQFKRAQTSVEPWKPTTSIIETGLFGYSRNPIYLAFCIATAGIGLIINSWWVILGLPILVFLLWALVIRKEETYLEARFEGVYLDYKQRVRRWI